MLSCYPRGPGDAGFKERYLPTVQSSWPGTLGSPRYPWQRDYGARVGL